jgi:CTP:molybdopterin cytidylyltransferase MocA
LTPVPRGPTLGVLLAAGASERMGTPKALLCDARGQSFLARTVRTLRQGGCDAVLVVAGRHVKEIAAALPEGTLLAFNGGWKRGQLSSASSGLRAALSLGASRVVLHLVDHPLATSGDVARVLRALERGDLAIAMHRGEPGHPIALSAGTARRVLEVRAASLREALARSTRRRVAALGCSRGCVQGANTPGELARLLRARQGKVKLTTTGA